LSITNTLIPPISFTGEAICHQLCLKNIDFIGLDLIDSRFTTNVGSICDVELVNRLMIGVETVYHTATLHKPHIHSHSKQQFIDTNVKGTLTLLEAAVSVGTVKSFVFTSSTTVFGRASAICSSSGAAAWIDERVVPIPKNIYGVSKFAAEQLCQLFASQLSVVVLRTSRFFSEPDFNDEAKQHETLSDTNYKVNELLYRRVDLQDCVDAHLLAAERAPSLGFAMLIISATTPFTRDDCVELATQHNVDAVVARRCGDVYSTTFGRRGWRMFERLDRVYDNALARQLLDWRPTIDFQQCLTRDDSDAAPWASQLTLEIGSKSLSSEKYYQQQ
jgi:UDP-glucose 4-epimerase